MPEIDAHFIHNEYERDNQLQDSRELPAPKQPELSGHFVKFVKSLHEDAEPEKKEPEVPDLASVLREDEKEHTFSGFDTWLKSEASTKFITNLLMNLGLGGTDLEEMVSAAKNTIAAAEHEFSLPAVQAKLKEYATEAQARAQRISGSSKTIKQAREEAKAALGATTEKELDAKVDVMHRGYNIMKRGLNAVYNTQVQGVLLNPRIPAAKFLTDVLNIPTQAIFKGIGVFMEHGPEAGINALYAQLHGFRESWKDALQLAIKSYRTGDAELLRSLGIKGQSAAYAAEQTAWDDSAYAHGLRYIASMRDAFRSAYSSGGRLIMSADQFAKAIARRGEMHVWAYYDGLNEAVKMGMKGAGKLHYAEMWAAHLVNHPPDWLFEKAMQEAHKTTFTEIDSVVKAVEQLRGIPFVKNFVLFFRTPYDIAKEAGKISPLGALHIPFEPSGLDRKTQIAKTMVGSALTYLIGHEVNKGNITGDGPQGRYRKEWPGVDHPRSIRLGGVWRSYEHMGPFAALIAANADIVEMYNMSEQKTPVYKAIDSVLHTTSQVVEHLPLMQQMVNFVHVLDSWRISGAEKAAQEFFGRAVTIPSPIRLAEQVISPSIKDAHGWMDRIAENIPFWSDYVEPKRDEYGHIEYPEGAYESNGKVSRWHYIMNQLNVFPSYDFDKIDDVEKEKFRLQFAPDEVPRFYWKSGDVSVPLSDVQHSKLERYVGEEKMPDGNNLHDSYEWLMKQPWYQDKRLNDSERKKMFEQQYHAHLEWGKSKLDEEYKGALSTQEMQLKQQQATGGGDGGEPVIMPETTVTPETGGSVINTPVPEATPKIGAP